MGDTDEDCQAPGPDVVIDWEPYLQRSPMYTDQTEWPYTDEDVCGTKYVFTNDNPDDVQTLHIFTEGGLFGFGVTLTSAITAFLLF